MTKQEFIETLNALRKKSKGWYELQNYIGNTFVQVKGYKTWLQIVQFNGVRDSSPMDMKVGEFNVYLNNILPES